MLFPDYLGNPGVASIVNDRNYDRITGLIDDAVAEGATELQVVNEQEKNALPSREGRRIPPTVLLDVPESALITNEEIFGPVLAVYAYDDVQEVNDYVSSRPSPLAAGFRTALSGGCSYRTNSNLARTRALPPP